MKRIFDLLASGLGLLLLSPLLLLTALVIKIDSPGPVIFRQTRVGRQFRNFHIFKFRTVGPDAALGAAITAAGDPRVTRVGRWLRKWKIDELPQLLNVLRGEMSLVGPRPEVPAYVQARRTEYRALLAVRPGMTDPASMAFRNESDGLVGDQYLAAYENQILPDKIRIARRYLEHQTFWTDVWLILCTLGLMIHLPQARRWSQRWCARD